MANLSIREAVKHFDVSRPTLANALKTGKVAGVKDGQGQWQIDPAELARVYNARSAKAPTSVGNPDNLKRSNESELSAIDRDIDGQVEILRESLAEAEKRAAESEQRAIENAQRAAVAEALAEERKRILDETLKLIPPPTPVMAPAPASVPTRRDIPQVQPEASTRRRWWPF